MSLGTTPIVLRGHHLDVLAEYLAKRRGDGTPVQKIDYVSEAARDQQAYGPSPFAQEIENPVESEAEHLHKLYDGFLEKGLPEFLDELLANPETSVTIEAHVVDAICERCPRLNVTCDPFPIDPPIDAGDLQTPRDLGLTLKRTYSVRELVEAIEAYQRRTGAISPRNKRIDDLLVDVISNAPYR